MHRSLTVRIESCSLSAVQKGAGVGGWTFRRK